jgi:hypothetical protein
MKRLVLLAALVVGLGFSIPRHAHAATCVGASPCKACKNCNACGHCKKGGGTCGVCKR